jgi:predicted DNA-binding ribbon-helix-helix protein
MIRAINGKAGMKSIVKHSVSIAGRRTSISLENEFWDELRKIAAHRHMSISGLIHEIKANRQHGNACSAIRLFVLGFYRDQSATSFTLEAKAQKAEVVASQIGPASG